MASFKLSLKLRPWAWAAGAALLVIGGILGFRQYQERPLTEFPRPPIPKAFPACPEVATTAYEWHGLHFRYPADWSIKADERKFEKTGERILYVRPRPKVSMLGAVQSIGIMTFTERASFRQAVDAAWDLPEGKTVDHRHVEMMGDETVPETIQKIQVDGLKGVLFLQRGMGLLPKENDEWSLVIKGGKADYLIGGPALFNPYYIEDGPYVVLNEELEKKNKICECAYWTVVKSLKLP